MRVEVVRKSKNEKQTIGQLSVINNKEVIYLCNSLELPWKENKSKISCIPTGKYTCVKRRSTRAIPYQHILINNVEGRSGVCIHKGNYYTQIQGCILVGTSLSDINKDGELDVVNSGVAFDKLMNILPNEFELKIV